MIKLQKRKTVILLVFFIEDMHKLFFHFPKKTQLKFQLDVTTFVQYEKDW